MDMYQKREMRRKKREEADQSQLRSSVPISWDRQIYVPNAWNPYK